jgi:hypothetical protein
VNCLFGGYGNTWLLGGDGIEGNQELVVDSSSVVEEQSNNLWNTAFTVFVKELWSVGIWGELGISTVGNRKAFVRQEMGFGWTRMFELDEKVLDVAGHTDTTPAGCVVPFEVNTRKLVAGHVELDPMELLENIVEMVEVFYPNILLPKAINYETELDGMPFVAPEA